jgi:diguanylate cyclase (GGDEF)-like protein
MSSEGRPTSAVGAQTAEQERDRLLEVLQVQADLQDLYIRNGADRAWWDAALRNVIALSRSQFGFLGRIVQDESGAPYLHSLAITDIAWNAWSRKLFDEFASQGLEFRNLQSLFGVTVATGEVVVSDDPSTDPRGCGLPPGHPPLDSYIGIPLTDGDALIGMIGVANRTGGYDPSIIGELRPVLSVVAQMVARDAAERRATAATAEAEELGAAVAHLTQAERDRRVVDGTVDSVLAAVGLGEAEAHVAHGLAALAPGMTGIVLSDDPDNPDVLCDCALAAAGARAVAFARDDCVALVSGRTHISLPGLRLGTCAHADPRDALTICAPIATPTDEYGLLVSRVRELPGAHGTARARMIADGVERVASALAQVALRGELTSRALRDSLTGLPNRAALMQAVERRFARIDAAARPFAVMIVDIDDFKVINDDFGHVVGDTALTRVADVIVGSVRDVDIVSRLGGDEFVVILGTDDADVVRRAGERIVADVAGIGMPDDAPLGASAGAVLVGWGDPAWEDAYRGADACLYAAKQAGKGRVVVGGLLGTAEQA